MNNFGLNMIVAASVLALGLAGLSMLLRCLTKRQKKATVANPAPADVADLLTQLEHLEDDACDEGQSYSFGGRVDRDLIDRLRASVGLQKMIPLELRKEGHCN